MKLSENNNIIFVVLISLFVTQIFSSFLFNVNLLFAFYLLLILLKREVANKKFDKINKLICPLPLFTFGLIVYNAFTKKDLLFYDNQLLLTLFNKKTRLSLPLKDKITPLFIFTSPVCIMVNLFGNAGYKFVFNFFPIFLLFKILSFTQKFYIFSIFYFIPIYALLNLPNNHAVFSPSILYTSVWSYSRVNFYLINLLFIIVFFNILRDYRKIHY